MDFNRELFDRSRGGKLSEQLDSGVEVSSGLPISCVVRRDTRNGGVLLEERQCVASKVNREWLHGRDATFGTCWFGSLFLGLGIVGDLPAVPGNGTSPWSEAFPFSLKRLWRDEAIMPGEG